MIGNASKLLNYPDRLDAFWANKPVIPITVEIHPTNKCNQNCSYCSIRHDNTTMTPEQLAYVVEQCKNIGIRGLVFSGGGEPLLGRLESALCTTLPCGLVTNGGVEIDKKIFSAFRWVRFSVDSCDKETYQRIRGVEWPECLEDNIRVAAKQSCVGIQMVITEQNIGHCFDMVPWARSLGADYLQIRPDDYNDNFVWLGELQQKELLAASRDDFRIILRQDKIGVRKTPRCMAGHFTITVTADLNCWICACERPRFLLGSLKNESLRDVVFGPRRKKQLANAFTQDCPRMCRGANINSALWECGLHSEFL